MSNSLVALLLAGATLLVMAGCASESTNAQSESGVQKATVVIDQGYSPSEVRVQQGKPVEVTFRAGESLGCGETIVFKTLSQTKTVKKGESVTFTFTPDKTGDIPFSCSMDMYRGKVVVQ